MDSKQRVLIAPNYTPGKPWSPGSVKLPCSQCGIDLSTSQSGLAMMREHNLELCCAACAKALKDSTWRSVVYGNAESFVAGLNKKQGTAMTVEQFKEYGLDALAATDQGY